MSDPVTSAARAVALWRIVSSWSGNVSFFTKKDDATPYGHADEYVALPRADFNALLASSRALEAENARLRAALARYQAAPAEQPGAVVRVIEKSLDKCWFHGEDDAGCVKEMGYRKRNLWCPACLEMHPERALGAARGEDKAKGGEGG